MSSQPPVGPTSSPPGLPPPPPPKSGIRLALEYTGIPASWLSKRPKLPSRNWLIFLTVTSSITGYYAYDRRQCKRIRREYEEKVKHLADQTMDALDWPRKVKVYAAKWPGDEEYDRGMKYFRKYVKPYLVAAAIDYDMVIGKRHGDLATKIADEIKQRRRRELGLEPPPFYPMQLPTYKSPEETRRYELDGGTVIVGRQTFKEYMSGLKAGWTESPQNVDREENLARELENDHHFDEPDDPVADIQTADSSEFTPLSSKTSPVFSPLKNISTSTPASRAASTSSTPSIPESMIIPPQTIPSQPPLLFVSFTNYIGFSQLPLMFWDFFNQRRKYQAGADSAYRLIMKASRPIEPPTYVHSEPDSEMQAPPTSTEPTLPKQLSVGGDLDFDLKAETFYKSSLSSFPADTDKARKKYYDALPAKLATARAIARNTREMTKDELSYPPPTEVELRAERLKKERRWRSDLDGWNLIKPEAAVEWDERFRDTLAVFVDPPKES